MRIPHDQLQPETLERLIEEFVTRHGAVHGQEDVSLSVSIQQVMRQLRQGKAVIVYDQETETCNIMAADEVPRDEGEA